ncbi:MAG: glycoside hydrolase family 16 protein [Actinobacteria bacterium]|nr:glycoside hydrolase family 16 protein [Actinomycetota bacterium]
MAVAVGAIALVAIASACEPTPDPTGPTTTSTTVATPTGWRLVGGDEFDGTALDTTRWKPYHSNYGSANLQLECNTPANVAVSGGSLRIMSAKQTVATCPGSPVAMDYTSGFVGSRETGTYYPRFARFEIRAKVPHAQGLWPAFWLRHRNGASTAEVDVMEYFHSQLPGKVTQTLHLDGVANVSKRNSSFEAPTPTPGWHTFAAEIAPDPGGIRFTFLLDGAVTHTYVDPTHAWADKAPESATWDIAINQAVGGRWAGHPDGTLGLLELLGRCSISGTAPDGCTTTGIRRVDWSKPTQTTYEVDWVRVYQRAT